MREIKMPHGEAPTYRSSVFSAAGHVCHLDFGYGRGAEDNANARLIVTAVNCHDDLLAALKVTAGNIRSLGPAGALGAIPGSYEVWLREVEAAIARAEGRQ